MTETDSLLEFPCRFPIKVMGRAGCDLPATVLEIVRLHAPDTTPGAVQTRASRAGNYVAVTVTVEARSREQLDSIYHDLTAHEAILMAL